MDTNVFNLIETAIIIGGCIVVTAIVCWCLRECKKPIGTTCVEDTAKTTRLKVVREYALALIGKINKSTAVEDPLIKEIQSIIDKL